ncbi:phospholipase [Phocaeicola oris]|uniref:phospholipase n=1 Tax=Phocaeicola oris TaxID=2896850 RepID=UPI00234F2A2B|nr:phospholipase [Phocaeicola oris]MCE2616833.1 phospholipase [Phocaeicola oris]
MIALILLLIAAGIIAMVAGHIHNRQINKKIASGELDKEPDIVIKSEECEACNHIQGTEGCELDCVLQKAKIEIEYYEDEELDRYKGRPSDDYTEEEAQEFRDILETCLDSDVPGWNRSLELRGINVPDQIKDELYILLSDQVRK